MSISGLSADRLSAIRKVRMRATSSSAKVCRVAKTFVMHGRGDHDAGEFANGLSTPSIPSKAAILLRSR
eukprot:CAMPEP_0184422748 /NCGR_PEP_ID=MMETSP0738-20130409/80595_1 /TAXON_ID=385413 /ORGANISM="Thalassiosira miniscula, Strain CCMP1093" /LENGTH=68 /DNA_ID=CAMNT_0026784565 /DNA_START=84 /DNA_END=287 /DNA_ORIENTATION=+